MREQNENIRYNFPMFYSLTPKTTDGMLKKLMEFNDKFVDVSDPTYVAAMHFNRLIVLLLRDIPKMAPMVEEEELKLKGPILFNLDKGPSFKQMIRLYFRGHNLHAHHIHTFEDMLDTQFWQPHHIFSTISQHTFDRAHLMKVAQTTSILQTP